MPDESTLTRWLDDDLQGAELAAFEASILGDADLFAQRDDARVWRAAVAAVIPAVTEPPYPEFFNSRIAQAIREQAHKPASTPRKAAFWHAWWMPATALAGMTLAFWLGTLTGGRVAQTVVVGNPAPVAMAVPMPMVYTPEHGVDAESFSSSDAAATVIVLEGVDAIPDTLDFSESVGWQGTGKSTAALETPETQGAEVAQ